MRITISNRIDFRMYAGGQCRVEIYYVKRNGTNSRRHPAIISGSILTLIREGHETTIGRDMFLDATRHALNFMQDLDIAAIVAAEWDRTQSEL